MQGINGIKYDKLALYVDCSTCIAMGQQSPFFQSLIPCWVNATKEYYSIKGSEIVKEEDDTLRKKDLYNINQISDIDNASDDNDNAVG